MSTFTIKDLAETYGVSNLAFVFETEVFNKSMFDICNAFQLGFALTSGDMKRCPMIITEKEGSCDKVGYSHKVTFKSLTNDPLVPLARFYNTDFECRIAQGYVSIFKVTPDGLEPIHVMLEDMLSVDDQKAKQYVEDNFFLLQPFIGEMKTDWN